MSQSYIRSYVSLYWMHRTKPHVSVNSTQNLHESRFEFIVGLSDSSLSSLIVLLPNVVIGSTILASLRVITCSLKCLPLSARLKNCLLFAQVPGHAYFFMLDSAK